MQGTVADAAGPRVERRRVRRLLRRSRASARNLPIGTWFRNSGTTQYGGHAHIVMPAVTGSEATGQASGAAGLVKSYGRAGRAWSSRRTRSSSCFTLTAEDVVAAQHGRQRRARPGAARLGPALRLRPPRPRARAGADRRGQDPAAGADHVARLVRAARTRDQEQRSRSAPACPRARGPLTYRLRVGAGRRARRGGVPRRSAASTPPRGADRRRARQDRPRRRCARRSTPAPAAARPTTRPPREGPRRHGPQRARLHRARAGDRRAGNAGEDRKVLFAYRDETLHEGWLARASAPAARPHSGCSTSTATTGSTSCSPTPAASCAC